MPPLHVSIEIDGLDVESNDVAPGTAAVIEDRDPSNQRKLLYGCHKDDQGGFLVSIDGDNAIHRTEIPVGGIAQRSITTTRGAGRLLLRHIS